MEYEIEDSPRWPDVNAVAVNNTGQPLRRNVPRKSQDCQAKRDQKAMHIPEESDAA